jgi:hypothetical protein
MVKTLNSPTEVKTKYLIECNFPYYRVGNTKGKIPYGHDCVISGWHFKKGRVINKGTVKIVPGSGNIIIRENIIEN